eukprot:scaffold283903_cov18-Tisochrysis_lutea.AAC.4
MWEDTLDVQAARFSTYPACAHDKHMNMLCAGLQYQVTWAGLKGGSTYFTTQQKDSRLTRLSWTQSYKEMLVASYAVGTPEEYMLQRSNPIHLRLLAFQLLDRQHNLLASCIVFVSSPPQC